MHTKAKHGETFGISVSNVMTHVRFAVTINNTLLDADINNIRIFSNGHMLTYMGAREVKNVSFRDMALSDNGLESVFSGHGSGMVSCSGFCIAGSHFQRWKELRWETIKENANV